LANKIKLMFPLRPTVYCPKCNTVMEYVKAGLQTELVHRTDNSCAYVGKRFRAPVITLEEIDGR
jgi:hypothetical protein